MSVFNPRYRKMIVEAARGLMEGCRGEDGAIDKQKLETEVREHLFSNLALKDWYDLKDQALRFTIYEYVKWTIRNTKAGGAFKGECETGRRALYQVPTKGARGFTAKPWEALTVEDLEALKKYHEAGLTSRMDDLARITAEIQQRTSQPQEERIAS